MTLRSSALRLVDSGDFAFGAVVATLPDGIKYGRRYVEKGKALAEQSVTPGLSLRVQREMLKTALEEARSTDYWREVIPSTIEDPYETLSQLPVLNRGDLLEGFKYMVSAPVSALDLMATSGSGGAPVSFYLPRERRSVEWAYVTQAWKTSGYTNRDWRVVFRGFFPKNQVGVSVNRSLREVRVTAVRMDETTYREIIRRMLVRDIRFVHGYPSALALFARWVAAEAPEVGATVRGVFPVSEKFDVERELLLSKAFPNAVVVPFYGLSEKAAFAVTKIRGVGQYTFMPTYGYVEILDDEGRAVTEGQTGRIVATRLEFSGASLLRYDTGDVARVINQQSEEEATSVTVADLSPRRSVAYIVALDGREVVTSPGLEAGSDLFTNTILEYQLVQSQPGRIEFLYRPISRENTSLDAKLKAELQKKLGRGFVVQTKQVTEIPHRGNGKKPLVVRQFGA